MASKTFKLGEYAKGGVISVIATKTKVTVIGKEWDTSEGYSKGSDQSNAKEFTRIEVDKNDIDAERKLNNFILDLTTSYYTDKIMEYIERNTQYAKKAWFGW
jgi:hypothetical protein